jgi:hypothetical protein
MHRTTWSLLAALAAGCAAENGEDEDSDDVSAGAESPDCAPADDPAELTIRDVAPAPGSTVPNADIVHRFVIADSPGVFTSLQLLLEPEHTAGTLDPPAVMFSIVPMDDDIEYSLPALRWMAVGHVEVSFGGGFVDDDGCHWVFPPGIFSYDLSAAD